MEGVDFDWEYPGALDIPGVPSGSPDDGKNYVKLLRMVRELLLLGKSLSIATPASLWYLKGIRPISDFGLLLDYMVYMTYDLHGQWDYGNKWGTPGGPMGSCLHSHVNFTETQTAMRMITRAGMPANKLIMGVTRYGSSFKMPIEPGCTGPMCTFVGPESRAKKGRSTETAGYLAQAEINEIIENNPSAKTWHDKRSDSDVLVYEETEWIVYMTAETRNARQLEYGFQGFGGIVEWAVDLGYFYTVPEVEYEPCDEEPRR